MLMAGRNIRDVADKLMKVKLDYLYHSIRNPKPEIATLIRLLRTVKDIDRNRYAHVKKQLPYFVCGTFTPPYLTMENFAYIEHFVIEVSKLTEKGIDADALKQSLCQDKRVGLMFCSPSKDSLKILFSLNKRCYDIGMFTVFYNIFVKRFLEKHQIDTDATTYNANVMQACFISVDEYAYYNALAEGVDIEEFLNMDDPVAFFDSIREIKVTVKEQKKNDNKDKDSAGNQELSQETMLHIKEVLLGTNSVDRDKKAVTDVSELDKMVEGIRAFADDHGVAMTDVRNMLHARKMRFTMNGNNTEINLFKGSKGYFAVLSPIGNTSKRFSRIVIEIVNAYLADINITQ